MNVRVTKSGIILRRDTNVGFLVYSPYSGLFFAVHEADEEVLLAWLDLRSSSPPSEEHLKALGPGWAISMDGADYPLQHLIPNTGVNWTIIRPEHPILINWFLTGNCSLNCQYCYAQDLMHGTCNEPGVDDIQKISSGIISHNPLAVVLTGGDPLISQHLDLAIKLLHKKTGIIIDTNGYLLNEQHVEIFKKYNVFVRVSLDTELPKINDKLRPLLKDDNSKSISGSSSKMALDCIIKCIDAGIKVGVQTVVTKANRSDLESFGDKLYRLGVCHWRLMMVAPSKLRNNEYLSLRGDEKGQKRYYSHIQKQLRQKHKNWWHEGMAIQITHNMTPNAVVLVSPSGEYFTESNIHLGKENLSETLSSKNAFFDKVSMHAHAERYLNLTSKRLL